MLSPVAERHLRPAMAPMRLLVREPEGLLQVHTSGSFSQMAPVSKTRPETLNPKP